MKKIVLAALLACILCGVLIAGCTQMQASTSIPSKEVRIGVVASLTGPASATGKDMWQSAMIAADEINAKGGVYVKDLGIKVPIMLVQGDDESTREGGQKAVSRMISSDNVDLLVGGFSSAVTTAHQSIVADNKVPYIITGASSPTITRRTDVDTTYMFHFCPTLRLEQEASERLGTTVEIRPGKKGSGKVIVHYAGLDHLDTLLRKLR